MGDRHGIKLSLNLLSRLTRGYSGHTPGRLQGQDHTLYWLELLMELGNCRIKQLQTHTLTAQLDIIRYRHPWSSNQSDSNVASRAASESI